MPGANAPEIVASRFALEAKVGSGASGEVFRARDAATGQLVAVKRLFRGHDDPMQVERFRREARLLQAIDHPNVVRFVESGTDGSGRLFLVVEWLEGEDLSRRKRRGGLTAGAAIEMARQAALGLDALHRAGIVHRDVKPSNLFVVAREGSGPVVKVIDLGVARGVSEATLTAGGLAIGTPMYMSPEQARGADNVTFRSDLFSLGVLLFELIAGERPYKADDVLALLAKIVLQDPPRLSEIVPGIPAEIDAAVHRALRRHPEERYASAAEMAEALARLPPWDGTVQIDPPETGATETRLSMALSVTGEQRVITALFAELPPSGAGSPGAHDEAFSQIAEAHGGACTPTLGRQRIAVFGGSAARGDEAVRAARAAIAAAARIQGIRLAISTGRALSGKTGLSGELIERGVAELDRHASRGSGIRIDAATLRLVGDHFVVESEGEVHFLCAARAPAAAPHTLAGRPSPCVGRDREIGLASSMYAEVASDGVARALLFTGAPGIGKSRVRREWMDRLADVRPVPAMLFARSSPIAQGSAFGLIAQAIRRLAGILEGEPEEIQRARWRAHAERVLGSTGAADVASLLGETMGLSDGAARAGDRADAMLAGDRLRRAWIAWLAAECARAPVVIALEDLQWGDVASIELVGLALRDLADAPLFVIAFARPEVHERFPRLWAGRDLQQAQLGPLAPRAGEKLVRDALGNKADPGAVARIVGRAEGNPFFLEELIRAVLSGGDRDLPDTVLGVVQARLDALGAASKRVLRAASVFGTTFWQGGVSFLLGATDRPHAAMDTLAELVAGEVVARRDAARFPGEEEYAFRHALVRDAAYAMLPDTDRTIGHRLAGLWLSRMGVADPAALAAHFEQGEVPSRAAELYLDAAVLALRGNDFAGAIAHAESAVRCGATGAARGEAQLVTAEARRWRGELADAAAAGAEAAELLAPGGAAYFHAVREVIAASGRLGQIDRVRAWTEEALAIEASLDADSAHVACLVPAAVHLMYAGDGAGAARVEDRIREIVDGGAALAPAVVARLHQLRAMRADLSDDVEQAAAEHTAALAAFEAAGDARSAALTLSNLGYAHAALGNFEEAEQALRRAHAGASRMGLTTIAPLAMHNLGMVLARRGRLGEAIAAETLAVEAFRAHGDPRLEGASRVYLADIRRLAGQFALAEEEARRGADKAFPAAVRAGAHAALCRALLAQNRMDEALAAAFEAVQLLRPLGKVEEFEVEVHLAAAEAFEAVEDRRAAAEALLVALARVRGRAARIRSPEQRRRFLEDVPDHARCLALAHAWGMWSEEPGA